MRRRSGRRSRRRARFSGELRPCGKVRRVGEQHGRTLVGGACVSTAGIYPRRASLVKARGRRPWLAAAHIGNGRIQAVPMVVKQFLQVMEARAEPPSSSRCRIAPIRSARGNASFSRFNAHELESESIRSSHPPPCPHPPADPTHRLARIRRPILHASLPASAVTMANEQSGCPLRRWRPFYGAFGAIDDAIEEAGGHPRAAFKDVRVRILQLLRAATDDGVAEQLCGALDEAMAEALETLRVAPVPHGLLASTDLARTVGALEKHGSPRIRRLAGDVVRGWTAGNVATTTAVKEELGKLSADDRIPRRSTSAVIADGNARGHKEKLHVQPAKMLPTAESGKKKLHIPPAKMVPAVPVAEADKKKVYVPPAKMLPTTATVSIPNTSETKKPAVDESKKMEATKRKLREGYEEAEKIKRQHIIKKINDKDAAKMFEQKQRKMHPVVRRRSGPAACRTSSGVRRSLLPSLQMI
ncbi:hypothetical protein BDA96_10G312500 [Sorghum bicolor]|uniref:TFIIS N-terminal domain-containing protein n=1 Tax=Sorghum bicolor TaxID=4558 RepID=A0A921U237_SORBI|nr:hypothetical protein BDA96_10G312500 [Sorghum bicolor]